MMRFFIEEPTADALHTGVIFLKILSPFYFVISAKLVFDGILRGSGMMTKFMIATMSDLVVRVVVAVFLAKEFGSTAMWCAWPIGWCVGCLLTGLFYRTGEWCKKEQ